MTSDGHGREPYLYALVRAVPCQERGELLNVGALLYCQNLDFLAAATYVDEGRLRVLAPSMDIDVLTAALAAFVDVAAGRGLTAVAAEPARVRFGWLTSPRSALVQAGPVHAGLTDDPAAALVRLTDRLVR